MMITLYNQAKTSIGFMYAFGFGLIALPRLGMNSNIRINHTSGTLQPLVHALYGMKRKEIFPMWDNKNSGQRHCKAIKQNPKPQP